MEEIENIMLFICNKHFGLQRIKSDTKLSDYGYSIYLEFITIDNYQHTFIYNKVFDEHYIVVFSTHYMYDNTCCYFIESFNTYRNSGSYNYTYETIII